MEKNTIERVLRDATKNPLPIVSVTFTVSVPKEEVSYLLGMAEPPNEAIQISNHDRAILKEAASAGKWERESNRTVLLLLTRYCNRERFARKLECGIENIEVYYLRPLPGSFPGK